MKFINLLLANQIAYIFCANDKKGQSKMRSTNMIKFFFTMQKFQLCILLLELSFKTYLIFLKVIWDSLCVYFYKNFFIRTIKSTTPKHKYKKKGSRTTLPRFHSLQFHTIRSDINGNIVIYTLIYTDIVLYTTLEC